MTCRCGTWNCSSQRKSARRRKLMSSSEESSKKGIGVLREGQLWVIPKENPRESEARRIISVDPFNRKLTYARCGGNMKRTGKPTAVDYSEFLFWIYQEAAQEIEQIVNSKQQTLFG